MIRRAWLTIWCALALAAGAAAQIPPEIGPSTEPTVKLPLIYNNISDPVAQANARALNNWAAAVGKSGFARLDLVGLPIAIADTIELPDNCGCEIDGCGKFLRYSESAAGISIGAATRLVWRGPCDGRPMIKIKGWGCVLRGICCEGYYYGAIGYEPTTRASVGIEIERQAIGTPTGVCDFYGCTICGCQYGIRTSFAGGNEAHADKLDFYGLTIEDCPVGIHLRNHQSVCLNFFGLRSLNVAGGPGNNVGYDIPFRLFDIEAGGDVAVFGGACEVPGKVVHTSAIDENTGRIALYEMKFDTSCLGAVGSANEFKLLDQELDRPISFRCTGHIGNNRGAPYAGEFVHLEGKAAPKSVRLDLMNLDVLNPKVAAQFSAN
jgi:hypothetical protein